MKPGTGMCIGYVRTAIDSTSGCIRDLQRPKTCLRGLDALNKGIREK